MNSQSKTEPRKRWFLAGLAWIAFLIVFFFPVVFQGKVLAPLDILDHLMRPWSDGAGGFGVHNAFVYDAISQYLPYDWTICQSLKQDGYIGWNPYVYGGYALLENTMLCPGDWHHQLYRFLDFWTAWDLGIVLQFAIAGLGVLAMLRAEKIPPWAALVGSISFAFYSQHVLWIYHRWVLGASCWFPWIVWAVRRARHKKRLFDLASVVFTVLAFRGGHLQSCLFVATLVFCLFVADWWTGPDRCRPAGICRTALPYAILAICSSCLVMDVLLDTIPPYLEGCRKLPHKNLFQALAGLPTIVTSIHPTLLGTPQTLDGCRPFHSGLFDIKYGGAIPFVLAAVALFRKRAPTLPRLLFVVSLIIPFTPLTHWFYSRSTVLFGLGCAWLAAWTLANPLESISDKTWRILVRCGTAILAIWFTFSLALIPLTPRIIPALHRFVEKSLPLAKSSRHDWMLARADAFLESLPLWNPCNAIPALLVIAGLFAAWRIGRSRQSRHWATIVIACTFAEMFVWSRTWITFSDKPAHTEPDTLYPVPEWAKLLRSEMSDGGFLWLAGTRPDFDYLQINAQSGIGIPCLQGYETIRPATLSRPDVKTWDPSSFTEHGISHVLVLPGDKTPTGLEGWNEIANDGKLHLFRNPEFTSRFVAILANGSNEALVPSVSTPNCFRFRIPAGTIAVKLAMPWHRKWTATLEKSHGEIKHQQIQTRKSEIGSIFIDLNSRTESESALAVQFRP